MYSTNATQRLMVKPGNTTDASSWKVSTSSDAGKAQVLSRQVGPAVPSVTVPTKTEHDGAFKGERGGGDGGEGGGGRGEEGGGRREETEKNYNAIQAGSRVCSCVGGGSF